MVYIYPLGLYMYIPGTSYKVSVRDRKNPRVSIPIYSSSAFTLNKSK